MYGDGDGGSRSFDGTDDEDEDDNDDVQHEVKDDLIVDTRAMSSITGSRHNCEQGQPKPELRAGMPPQVPPHRAGGAGVGGGRGGYHGGGGRGVVAVVQHI